MSLRRFKMRQDTQSLIDIVPLAFQYPDHPEWSIDEAEKEDLAESFSAIKKLSWIIRGLGMVWSPLKDVMLGYIWEENGQPVGVCNVSRQGGSQQWMIGNVAVLPDYRRRGIARKLVRACVDLAIERGAEQIILDVIDGNVPAYELYKSMGFTHYAGQLVFEHSANIELMDVPALPSEYTTDELNPKDWNIRYTLAQRITPNHVQEFEPITESKYKKPPIIHLIQPLVVRLLGMQIRRLTIADKNHNVVGLATYEARKNGKGSPSLTVKIDKVHAQVSQPIMEQLLTEIRRISPTSTIELVLPDWQYCENEIDPTLAGFEKRMTNHRLGMQV